MKEKKYDQVIPTVDVVPWHPMSDKVLIIRKKNEPYFRFIGGHADVKDTSYENDAIREVKEETDVIVYNLTYVGSNFIYDPRWRDKKDKIRTILYLGTYRLGEAKPMDDVKGGEVKWVTFDQLWEMQFMPEHIILRDMLKSFLTNRKP